MCGEEQKEESILVVNSALKAQGTFNNFLIDLPFRTVAKEISLEALIMTVPTPTGVRIDIRELIQPVKFAGEMATATFYVQSPVPSIHWTPKENYDQVLKLGRPASLSSFTITVTDDSGAPIPLTDDWTMILKLRF